MALQLQSFRTTTLVGTFTYSAQECSQSSSYSNDRCTYNGQGSSEWLQDGPKGSLSKAESSASLNCNLNTNYKFAECEPFLFSPCYFCDLYTCQENGQTEGKTVESNIATADSLEGTYMDEFKREGYERGNFNRQCEQSYIRECNEWSGGPYTRVQESAGDPFTNTNSYNNTFLNTNKNTGRLCNTRQVTYVERITSVTRTVKSQVTVVAEKKITRKYGYPITRPTQTNGNVVPPQTKTWAWSFTESSYTDLTGEIKTTDSKSVGTTALDTKTLTISQCGGQILRLYDNILLAVPPEAIIVGRGNNQGIMVAPDNTYLSYTFTNESTISTTETIYKIKNSDYEPPDISTVISYKILQIVKTNRKPPISKTISYVEDLKKIPNKIATRSETYINEYLPAEISTINKSFEIKTKGEWNSNDKVTLVINGSSSKKIEPIFNTTSRLQDIDIITTYSITYVDKAVPFLREPKNCKIKYYRLEAEISSSFKNLQFVDPNTIGNMFLAYTTFRHMAAIGTTGPSNQGGSVMSANKSFKLLEDPSHFAFLGRRAIMPTTYIITPEGATNSTLGTSVTILGQSFRTNSNTDINKNTETLTITSSESIITQGQGLTTFVWTPEQAYLNKGTAILAGVFEKNPPPEGGEGETEYFSKWNVKPVDKGIYVAYSRRCKVQVNADFTTKGEIFAPPVMLTIKELY
jgi:hypothetical protein